MKILHVVSFFKPSWEAGGPPRAVYEISKKLIERGHDVTVYTTDGFKSRLKIEKNKPVNVDGIRTYYFRNLSNYLAKKFILPTPYYLPVIVRKELKNFDIVHIHAYRGFLGVVMHHYAKKYNIPYILQPRGSLPIMTKSKQKKVFDILFGHSIVKDATKIVASSKLEGNQYRNVFPDLNSSKIVYIPNGIDLKIYQNLPSKGRFRKKYSIDKDKKIILFLSRIHQRKGADVLVKAFNKLKNELDGIKLVIAGPDDGYLKNLQLMVKKLNIMNDVIFPGPLYEKSKLEAYIDADVFVLPSKDYYESFGNVALEACACSTPTIVTNVCGVSEWLNSIEVVDPRPNALYQELLRILGKSEGERIEMGKKSRMEVERFSWEEIVKKLEEIYHEVSEKREESFL